MSNFLDALTTNAKCLYLFSLLAVAGCSNSQPALPTNFCPSGLKPYYTSILGFRCFDESLTCGRNRHIAVGRFSPDCEMDMFDCPPGFVAGLNGGGDRYCERDTSQSDMKNSIILYLLMQ